MAVAELVMRLVGSQREMPSFSPTKNIIKREKRRG
jgi:hypothetical protein